MKGRIARRGKNRADSGIVDFIAMESVVGLESVVGMYSIWI